MVVFLLDDNQLAASQYIITTPNSPITSALVMQFYFEENESDGPESSTVNYVTISSVAIIAINCFGIGIFGETRFAFSITLRAIRPTFFRIIFFYTIPILLLGLNIPCKSSLLLTATTVSIHSVNATPFVIAVKLILVSTLLSFINACISVLTFAAAKLDFYIATRTLYSLFIERNVPSTLYRIDAHGVPVHAFGLSSALCTIAYISVHIGALRTLPYFIGLDFSHPTQKV
ncbi:hypothetical protein BOTCAL_0595g00020 [Botryotinia calthae]|uniref:Amino acid permease/ SLC12A domain-containing protein n=1 Tax=Botryotinia calthae TaxID=38488 RepID=A0A4Y8CIX2_9HELO|nr:hypothetical protein BOTCAL_0595g00020 [Botryotinia calthae]